MRNTCCLLKDFFSNESRVSACAYIIETSGILHTLTFVLFMSREPKLSVAAVEWRFCCTFF